MSRQTLEMQGTQVPSRAIKKSRTRKVKTKLRLLKVRKSRTNPRKAPNQYQIRSKLMESSI